MPLIVGFDMRTNLNPVLVTYIPNYLLKRNSSCGHMQARSFNMNMSFWILVIVVPHVVIREDLLTPASRSWVYVNVARDSLDVIHS